MSGPSAIQPPHSAMAFSEVAVATVDAPCYSPIGALERKSRTSPLQLSGGGATPLASDSSPARSKFPPASGSSDRLHARADAARSNSENFSPPDISATDQSSAPSVPAAPAAAAAAPGGQRRVCPPGREATSDGVAAAPGMSAKAPFTSASAIPDPPKPFSSPRAALVCELPDRPRPQMSAAHRRSGSAPDPLFTSPEDSLPPFRRRATDPLPSSTRPPPASKVDVPPRMKPRVPTSVSTASDPAPISSGKTAPVVPPPLVCVTSSAAVLSTTSSSSQRDRSGGGGESRDTTEGNRSLGRAGKSSEGTGTSNSSRFRSDQNGQKVIVGPPEVPTADVLPRRAVAPGEGGQGWPYAPQGWPEPDDVWRWRVVGKRTTDGIYYKDRSVGLPQRLANGGTSTFFSKKSVAAYLHRSFPGMNVQNFFDSFQWRVPRVPVEGSASSPVAGSKARGVKRQKTADEEDAKAQVSPKRFKALCRVANPNCGLTTGRSLLLAENVSSCDVCCAESDFCRECKCIICCKIIVPEEKIGEFVIVRCRQRLSDDGICGHAAHLDCALHAREAGVVEGMGLNIEYNCRRCSKKSCMRQVVSGLLNLTWRLEEVPLAKRSLDLALQLIKGTDRVGGGVKTLEALVQTALEKLRSGADIKDVYKELLDQGAAAEAAVQPKSARRISIAEDAVEAAQQREASLDQWLPKHSHPAPETPSSLTSSPPKKSCPSVTSGHPHAAGKETDFADSTRADASEGSPPDARSNAMHLSSVQTIRSAGQAGGSVRIQALSFSAADNGNNDREEEAVCESHSVMTSGDGTAIPPRKTGNGGLSSNCIDSPSRPAHPRHANKDSRPKNEKDRHRVSVLSRNNGGRALALSPHLAETCKACGAVSQIAGAVPVEVTSWPRAPDVDGSAATHRAEEVVVNVSDRRNKPATAAEALTAKERRAGPLQQKSSWRTALQLLDAQCARDIREALQGLRASQEAEFRRAEERLNEQRVAISRQYEQLETARLELSEQPVGSSLEAFDELLLKTTMQFAKAAEERETFKTMLKVSEGFARVPKEDLHKFFASAQDK